MPSTEQLKNIASQFIEKDRIDNIENLASDVEKFFLTNFDDRFPGIDLTDTDKDALTHFYGQTISQQEEGTVPTILAGLFNELRGLSRGYTTKSVIADLINNMSAVLPDVGQQQQEKYGNILSGLIQNPESTIPNQELQQLIDYGLQWTVDPPEKQKYQPK
tara:strand:- start:3113 stop:3595 length:483 start_codon:yes stop_codon:yes gene_type:complete